MRLSWDEVATRGIQGISKRVEAGLYRVGVKAGSARLQDGPLPAAHFLFGPAELAEILNLLRQRLPHEVDRITQEAERICQHRFDLLGYRDLDYGREIDWHLDAVHGKRAPLKPWFKVRYLDFDEVGDHKVTWELSRHQHLVTLAKAYYLARAERFVTELVKQWYDWQKQNPYPIGVNWASSLEVAFRSLSWLWVRHLLQGCPAVSARFGADVERALALNARHIERYLSTYFSPNTHLLGEGVALFFIGTLCPQFSAARRWRQKGWGIVLREADRQVRPDGMHFEQSLYYHVYALDFFLHARALATRNQIGVPPQFDRTLEKMLEILAALGQTGMPPRLGDDDGGRVFNPRRNRAEHMLDPLAVGAAIFGRADFKTAARGLTEELVWLLGPEGVARFDGLGSLPAIPVSRRFEPSGICVMASQDSVPRQLVIDAGPQGTATAGHGHADALSVQLAAEGRQWLVDPGTFSYSGRGGDRNLFRGTGAHNTLEVDGQDQAKPTGPFSWGRLPEVRVKQWVTGKTFDLFEGSHTGYARLREPVTHRRWVFNLKSRFWLVRDRAEGVGHHAMALNWHCAPDFHPGSMGHEATVLKGEGDNRLVFLPAQRSGWTQEIASGEASAAYGEAQPGIVLRFVIRAALPVEMAVVVIPSAVPGPEQEELGALTVLADGKQGAEVCGYCYRTPGGKHHMFFAEKGGAWKTGAWESDARFLYGGIVQDRQHWVLCGGSYVKVGGHGVIASRAPVECCEWGDGADPIRSSEGVEISRLSDEAAASAVIDGETASLRERGR